MDTTWINEDAVYQLGPVVLRWLEFKERRPLALRSVLIKHEASDLERFFFAIATQHPQLIGLQDLATIQRLLSRQPARAPDGVRRV